MSIQGENKMKKKTGYQNLTETRSFLAQLPQDKWPIYLSAFIDESGLRRQQLPTPKNEQTLLKELNEALGGTLTGEVLEKTEARLAQTRTERMHQNAVEILKKANEEKSILDYLPFHFKDR